MKKLKPTVALPLLNAWAPYSMISSVTSMGDFSSFSFSSSVVTVGPMQLIRWKLQTSIRLFWQCTLDGVLSVLPAVYNGRAQPSVKKTVDGRADHDKFYK